MLSLLLFLVGCGGLDMNAGDGEFDTADLDDQLDEELGDGDSDPLAPIGDSDEGVDKNDPPVADAGWDQEVEAGTVVDLDGSQSYDPNGDGLLFDWVIVGLPADSIASLINEDRDDPQIYVDVGGTYEIELEVSDGALTDFDDVIIEVTLPNESPVAVAGSDQTVTEGATVVLDGTGSYDPNGDALTYTWVLAAAPAGSGASLSDPTSPQPRFSADLSGAYEIELVVSDGTSDSSPDSVRISAEASGGSSGSSSCLSCSEPVRQEILRRQTIVGFASGPGLVGMPLGALLWWRSRTRRERDDPTPRRRAQNED